MQQLSVLLSTELAGINAQQSPRSSAPQLWVGPMHEQGANGGVWGQEATYRPHARPLQ